jgi:hypothetical protein
MQKRFTSFYDDKLAVSKLSGSDQDFSAELENGKKNFKPMYYIVPQDLSEPDTRVDMCFDCSASILRFRSNTLTGTQPITKASSPRLGHSRDMSSR